MKDEFEAIQKKAKADVNVDKLGSFLDKIFPLVSATL
jgi:hypothetical protein